MKTILKLAAALVLLVMIGGVVTLQSAIKDARVEQQELAKPRAESGAPADSKDGSRPAEGGDEVLRLREANKDLPKLRNEVRQLRRQAAEMAKLRADNEQLKNTPKTGTRQYPPDYIRRGALVDAGLATPEATIQTFFWAMTRGSFGRMKACLSPEAMAQMQMSEEQFQEQTVKDAKAIPGFRIVEKMDISSSEVRAKIEMMPGISGPDNITLRREGNEWKVVSF